MSEQQTVVDNYLGPAVCPLHPEAPAIGNCSRCGTFVCVADSKLTFGKLFCSACSQRPELNYLETLRLKYWGKRDSWAWFYGVSLFGYLAAASLYLLVQQDLFPGVLCAAMAAVCVFYWMGKPWARFAIIAGPLALAIYGFTRGRPELGISGVIATTTAISPLKDLRNKLFFQLPVTELALQKYWDLHLNNRAARNGAMLGMSSVIVPFFIPLAIGFSILGLARVDPHAQPPIGKRGYAITGLVFSVIAIAFWGTMFFTRYR